MLSWLLKRVLSPKWQRNLHYFRDLAQRMDVLETTSLHAVQGLSEWRLKQDFPPSPSLEAAEFRVYSQYGEDGILQYLFRHLGTTNRTFVEFGIQSGRQCNAALLALSQGWSGLFIEGDSRMAVMAREYYDNMLEGRAKQIRIVNAFITTANINQLLEGMPGDLDLLSIDIDGNDYWVWEAITGVHPRVVAIEYNAAFGLEAVTVPYEPSFQRGALGEGMYFGASLTALERLGSRKGYALVGCNSLGINAFFVRKDLLRSPVIKKSVQEAFRPHFALSQTMSQERQFALVSNLPLTRIS